jgi:hypothetical protein
MRFITEIIYVIIRHSPDPGISSGEIMVEAIGCVATAIAIAEWHISRITRPIHRHSPQDDGDDGQNVHSLLPERVLYISSEQDLMIHDFGQGI